jgi:hypothetical protein
MRKTLALTADDLAKFPRGTARFERDGEISTYEGVLLYDLLVRAGVKLWSICLRYRAKICRSQESHDPPVPGPAGQGA